MAFNASWKMPPNTKIVTSSEPRLFYMLESSPCITVIAVSRLIGIELDLKLVEYDGLEHKTKEFAKVRVCREFELQMGLLNCRVPKCIIAFIL